VQLLVLIRILLFESIDAVDG